ncbi:conjugal transfer protein TrbG/VirB9/CagX [Burkholderia lata]|uniref:hypothetical protein n=1 Tax=Burkholderia lata (strain ATCC 17760 / DSM 23089 / LMG 22485 / NCIMB 9086 / R18194 / 383) TaxID=482957 RepID=UPI001452F7A1|nr:hypothetical protein [Burkholderia lata]VWD52831.1 conjugal transfer protein TrbG/VirB9/CagX [Burkholderia lata]
MKRPRFFLTWVALASIAASANVFAAKNAANPIAPIPNFDVGSIIGDAMSPVGTEHVYELNGSRLRDVLVNGRWVTVAATAVVAS